MSFAPPPGPPPPSVPEGWKTQFDDRYKQWFFVNLRNGKSQWEPPEGPAKAEEVPQDRPSTPPPSYESSGSPNPAAVANTSEKGSLGSNNPYNSARAGDGSNTDDDARLAAQLQAEEDARAGVERGAASDYYSPSPQPQLGPRPTSQGPSAGSQSLTPEPKQQSRSRGFLGKLMGKQSSSSSGSGYMRPPAPAAPRPPPPQPYAYQQGGYYGGYPPQQPMGYGYPGYPPQGGYYPAQQQQRRNHGMGTAGAAALGVGGGLLGGALLAGAVDDFGDHEYDQGYDQGYDDGGDMGGGDMGGDF